MTPLQEHRVPFVTAIWMIVLPLVFAFLAGAGAGTVFNGLASFLGTLTSIFGGASLLCGVGLLVWVFWKAWQARDANPKGDA